jgi:nucleotide-binding universal stress UspA family protein
VLRCGQSARSIGDVIVRNAAVISANLVVMAGSTKSDVQSLIGGSASGITARRSPCPVLIVRGWSGKQAAAAAEPAAE